MRFRFALGLVFGAAGLALPCPAVPADPTSAQLDRAHAAILGRLDTAKRFLGADVANDIIVRLGDDVAYAGAEPPPGYGPADWNETVANVVRLDVELADQIVAATPQPLGAIRGLHETFVRAHDGTFQPIAVFVPPNYDASKSHSLIVALHGRPQSEGELLAQPLLRRLAETSGSIVVAPWGRGNYDFAEPAGSEVYDAVDAAESAFAIDRHKVYLVGYSMGGFAVFRVAPLHAERWSGIMSISGAILNSEMQSYVTRCRNINLYVVNGGEDESIPPKYGEQTASVLKNAGLAVGFYQEPRGKHELRTLGRVVGLAWDDMLAGRARRGLQNSDGPNGPGGTGGPLHPS